MRNRLNEQDAIIAALEEQVVCYRRLAKLAELQHEHVQQCQTEGLLEVLGRRQDVLHQIGRLEVSLQTAKGRWSEYLHDIDEDSRAKAEGLLAETRRLLEEITTADRNDALVLQSRKLNLGKAIQQATAARKVNRNYAAAAYGKKAAAMDFTQ